MGEKKRQGAFETPCRVTWPEVSTVRVAAAAGSVVAVFVAAVFVAAVFVIAAALAAVADLEDLAPWTESLRRRV